MLIVFENLNNHQKRKNSIQDPNNPNGCKRDVWICIGKSMELIADPIANVIINAITDVVTDQVFSGLHARSMV